VGGAHPLSTKKTVFPELLTDMFNAHAEERAVESWFSPSHRMQSACFISLQALLSCGALERARSSLKLASEQ
jgi:hypothetical protein